MQLILAAAEEQGRQVGLAMRQKELDNERREQQRLERKRLVDEQEIARQQAKTGQLRLEQEQKQRRLSVTTTLFSVARHYVRKTKLMMVYTEKYIKLVLITCRGGSTRASTCSGS